MGLNRMWKLSLGMKRLMELGKKLGADIPFFLKRTSFAVATKRGDEITPLAWRKMKFWHLVVYAPVKIFSRDIYGMYSGKGPSDSAEIGRMTPKNIGKVMHNDLERLVLKKEPIVDRVKSALRDIGIKRSLVSGSGPSVFSVFGKRKEAAKAKEALIRHFPFIKDKGWQIFVVPTL
jgi:4-diphosphocytidyl-2-C-methyl-D-erythritol kinase